MRYENIPNSLFIKNRKRFVEKMVKNSVAIFTSNDPMTANGDETVGFIQNSSFFYLTGIDQEDCYLILAPNNEDNTLKEILFVKETNEHLRVWEGEKLSIEEAQIISGIETTKWSKTFWNVLESVLYETETVYIHLDEYLFKQKIKNREQAVFEETKQKHPFVNFKKSSLIINKLRGIKQDEEITQVKKAIEITKKGFERAAKFITPGKFEFEIEAEISHEFTINRSRNHAFNPIMASGKNACVLHYETNNNQCQDGDLILMDFGAEYANYKADMSRTLPVNGKFTARQKQVYESVLYVMKETTKQMIPGNTLIKLKEFTRELIGKELVKLGLISTEELKTKPELINKYYPHGVSHNLGLETHDVETKKRPFEAGMLLTCEPGIYINEENMGVRLENDILITENGNIDLMAHIPIEIEEIEKLMNTK
jgi:Xaa-Pro aminopeptidase